MKLPFKLIAILVVLSLVGIFAYQTYWLSDLYTTMKKELEDKIEESIRRSDYNEMVCRILGLQKENKRHGFIEASAGFSAENDSTTVTTRTQVEQGEQSDYADSTTAALSVSPFNTIIKNSSSIDILSQGMQKGVHSALDNFIPLEIQVFDSLLTLALQDEGINAPHLTELVNHRDSVVEASIANDSTYIPSPQALVFEHSINMHGSRSYRVYIEPIDSIVWKQMTGILTTSLAIILLLGFSFYYLIRTILRQKTIEELKSDFTNNITHELKTPIAVAYAANDAILNFEQTKEKQKEYLHISQEQLKHLSGLIEQILSMSMEERKNFRLQPEPINLSEMVESLIKLHTLKAGKEITVARHLADTEIILRADRIHIYNVLSNLLDNAIKYSPVSAQITLSAWQTKEGTYISVADKGIGIPTDKQEQIFDRFYRVPTGNVHEVKGYGLGLYYVKTIVEKHGGTISVKSTPGKGSEFTLQIPHR